MKRFFCLLMVLAGVVACGWGGYYGFGSGGGQVHLPNDITLSSMTVGLFGIGIFTIGLIGYRE